ncbi:1,6-anhydro-N-acetylmuramyl-L-alanine amidase AmpD [Herbaspirillum sp. RV1423]|uniref:1,6-anhydro-N-acetylmuramyl-L-alanine amidase AmpD n=1 Tax=Herbaspirillum sp. RV1423 TaxID=1443993 RepID=UPI00054CDB81|nr:1,6-anhydro-N-acetylmuramyl-L-alanine amidase AmpD [Herbaspirillum sp. RV1423]
MVSPTPTRAADPQVWTIAADGWCEQAQRQPSPNFDARADGVTADLLVIHNISLPPGRFGGPFIGDLFCNRLDYDADPYFEQLRPLRVSAHFVIRRDGGLVQFVSANDRAWHAGVSLFKGRERCNDFSIGIELEGTDFEPFTDSQYQTLATLTDALRRRYPLVDVAGHEHVAPGRKTDPGPFFDWARFRADCPCQAEQAQLRFPSGVGESQA